MKNGNYTLVIAPKEYPGKIYRNRYCYEHHLVYWLNTGLIPKKDEILHHKDHNKRNNLFSNLDLIKKSVHNNIHFSKPYIEYRCLNCNTIRLVKENNYRYRIKVNKLGIFCTKRCATLYQFGVR